jgi:hypothetical protein
MDDHALVVITAVLAFVTVALALVGVGVAALAVPSHPDRAKAAKVCFSLAAVVFAGTIIFWTISKGYGLGGRILIDVFALCLLTIGILAGFRFAERSAFAELALPASAILSEPFFSRRGKLLWIGFPTAILVVILGNVFFSPQPEPHPISSTMATPSAPLPSAKPLGNASATPPLKPTPSPSLTPLASPASLRSPAPGNALRSFDRTILIKGGSVHRLDALMTAAGYKGSLLLQTLYIYNKDESGAEICWGDQPNVDPTTGGCVPSGEGYNFPGGRDARQVYLMAKKDMRLYVSALSR